MNEKEKLSGIENYIKELFPDVLLRTRGIPNLVDISFMLMHLLVKQNIR